PYMEAAGMSCDFVGHPVVSEELATRGDGLAFRAAHGIAEDAPVVLALPGSRRGEVARLGPRFGAALAIMAERHPDLRVIVPTVRGVAAMVRALVAQWPGAPVVVEAGAEKRAAFRAADVALAASGTVSLELAAVALPMVIAYDFNWLSRAIILRMVKLDTATLVNLVTETRT
ncbi:lipid-A-disaccharide synthase, partial [Thioclava sp. BHET1]